MAAPAAPTTGLLARALNPVAAAASASASSSSITATEMITGGLATSSTTAIISTTAASTTHIAASRSTIAILRSAGSPAGAGAGALGAGSGGVSARAFSTTTTALIKEVPAAAKPGTPVAAALRSAVRNPEGNSRIRITDGPPPDVGYVPEGTPITSEDPKKMPAAAASAVPLSQTQHASAASGAAHPGAAEMARGATLPEGGQDAVTVEERSTKVWGTNQRPADFNQEEGRRNPILHGGSNEGGFDQDGKSET